MVISAGPLGDFAAGAAVDLKFCTHIDTGQPTALSSGVVSVYQTNSTTQSTAGVTLTADFDSVIGLNHVRITTVTDGAFYAAARDFQIVLTGGTVSGTDHTGSVIGSFSIANRPVQSVAAAAIGLLGIAVAEVNRIADIVRRRTQANVEASSYGDTLDVDSQYGAIQTALESSISGTTLTVKKTDATTLGTKAITADPATGHITGIS